MPRARRRLRSVDAGARGGDHHPLAPGRRPAPEALPLTTLDCAVRACPGCPARDTTYDQQLAAKEARLRAALARYPALGALVTPEPGLIMSIVPAAHITGYRHRAKLPVEREGAALRIGLYTSVGRTVVDTPDCPVLHPEARAVLAALRPWLAEEGVAAPAGPVTGLDVRYVADAKACQVTIACKGGELPGGAHAARRLMRDVPGIAQLAVSRADPRGLRVLGDAPRVVAGPASLPERIGATSYRLTPGAFFQVDPRQAHELATRVGAALAGARRIADLYCGVGAYALALAPSCDAVVGIEESATAVDAARLAAREAGLEGRVRFVPRRSEDALAEGALDSLGGPCDGLVLNPARRGAHPRALEAIAQAAPAKVAYVSCDPDTLARDLDHLHWAGFRAVRVSPVDLFPQTFEVEAVVALEKVPRPDLPAARWVDGGLGTRAVMLPPWATFRPKKAVFLPPEGASGVAVLEGAWPGRARVLALVGGAVPQRGGRAGAGVYERVEALPGDFSLVRLHLPPASILGAVKALAKAGHAVCGDPQGDRGLNALCETRASLARPFLHVEALEWPGERAEADLPGDLALALDRMRARA